MYLQMDCITVRFFLPWKTACKLNHDVCDKGLNKVADKIQTLPFVDSIDIGSGHTGLYFDIHFKYCKPKELENYIETMLEYAKTLKV